jgi:aryl-alcohol dehydrogenase-like predicted oxidoreductase
MEYRPLGKTGLFVSRLCFGALTVGPLQNRLSVAEGAAVIRRAVEAGVNFIETAELYGTYEHIKEGIRGVAGQVVLATRSYAHTGEGMQKSLELALRSLKRDWVDVFLLHEQESIFTIRGHWEAVEYLVKAKEKGLVRAIGISTHSVEAVRAAALIPEFDVIQALINVAGIGIRGGGREEMRAAIREAHVLGKGLYGMKALGGGHLLGSAEDAFRYVLAIEELASCAVGMASAAEVDFNVRFFEGRQITGELRRAVARKERRLLVESWCTGCGRCAERCTAGALSVDSGKVRVERSLCRLCGYCGSVCPEFALKIV